jgi:hypothetical protein
MLLKGDEDMEDFMQEIIEMNEQHFSRQARHLAGLLLQGL